MPNDIEPLLERYVRACLDVFGADGVEVIILHGSAHKGGAVPGFSDVDFNVFLPERCFDREGALLDELAFAIQRATGSIPWRETGYAYAQATFVDARRLPDSWTGPVPGAHRVLWGGVPEGAMATPERLQLSARRLLTEGLSQRIAWSIRTFADADDTALPRRVRLLATDVAPAIFALVGYDADDPLEMWSLSKFAALDRLEERYGSDEGPALAREFYDRVRRLFKNEIDAELARESFRLGIAFLRWAEAIGRELNAGAR